MVGLLPCKQRMMVRIHLKALNLAKQGDFYMDTFENIEDYNDYTDKDRSRGKRRKQDYEKAISKYKKDKTVRNFGNPRYNNIHQYSKNKIHCSCLMCAFNGKRHGKIVFKAETHSDMKKNYSMEQKFSDYENAM